MLRKTIAAVLIFAMCLAFVSGCAGNGDEPQPEIIEPEPQGQVEPTEKPEETEPMPETSLPLIKNDGNNSVSYPYLVCTDNATWYISKADMELLGESEYLAGLESTLPLVEADFTDAQAVFEGYLTDPVPPVDIYTDFSAKTEVAQSGRPVGAIYRMSDRRIYLYGSWSQTSFTLLHEYTHYLSMTCADLGLKSGFWAEGLADYVAHFLCENSLVRSINFGLDENGVAFFKAHGLCDEEGNIEPKKYYYGESAQMHRAENLGQQYFAVSGYTMTLRESQMQHPLMSSASYFEAATFMDYLVENYGKDTVFAHLDTRQEDFESVYGKDFETLFLEWAQYDLELCEALGIKLD